MNRTATIRTQLKFASGVQIRQNRPLEVGLDCPVCRRLARTVIFATEDEQLVTTYRLEKVLLSTPGKPAICTKTNHDFPGRVVHQEIKVGEITEFIYRIEYEFQPFTDARRLNKAASEVPTWARISFTTTCPSCNAEAYGGAQSNTQRPWTKHCQCGQELYVEEDEMHIENVARLD